jgi:Spy/CpxP family protein refolding chaperone
MAEHHARMAERHQQHLEQLKARLQLTPEQEPAWRAYVARSQPGPAHSRPAAGADRPDLSTLTTPQRIERMKAWQAERQQAQQQRMDATLSFYAALRPEQRQTFDEATAPRFMRAGGHRHAPMTPEKARSS